MKKFLSLITIILLPLLAMAQTQQGYVKTKGRLNSNGTVTPGVRLSGATVVLKGGSSVVSGANGAFSMKVPSNKYYLQNVKKNGYLLVDPEVLSKTYAYSTNPLVISMETPDEQSADKLSNERKIRRTLQRTLQQREDEIEALIEQNKISEEEYRKALQKIYDEQSKNEKLISEMAERYSKIDYDQISDFDREFNQYILNGELTKADSLLNTKGDINSHINQYFELQEDIKEKEKNLEKEKELGMLAKEDLANRCEKKVEMFKIEYKNDSVAYYLGLRASLDTTNVKWQLEAGEFIADYIVDYDKAMSFYNLALRNAITQNGNIHQDIATCYINIGGIYLYKGILNEALNYFKNALDIQLKVYPESHPDIAYSLLNIGMVYNNQGNYEDALNHLQKALNIFLQSYSQPHLTIATSYNNIGAILNNQGNNTEALNYYQKGLELFKQLYGESHPAVATCYNNIGYIYSQQNNFPEAEKRYQTALSIQLEHFGESHPSVALSYNNIGFSYANQGKFDEALNIFDKALNIYLNINGENHPDVAMCYNNIGTIYFYQKDYSKTLKYFQKALEIYKLFFDETQFEVQNIKGNIDFVKSQIQENKTE